MEPEEMTNQKWGVLRYFVENATGYKKPYWTRKRGVVYPTDAGEDRFYSYPSRIHEDFGTSYFLPQEKTSITKDWAGRICEDLCAVGVLGSEMIKAPRQSGKTPHYYLKEGYEPYIQVMKFFFEMVTDPRMQRVTMNAYVQEHTDAALVRYILHKKGVEMHRMVPLTEWDAHEAPKVFEEYYRCRNQEQAPCSFVEYVQEMWRSHERGKPFSLFSFPPTISLRLPVCPEHLSRDDSRDERMKVVADLNARVFGEHPWLNSLRSGIDEHYTRYEYERWVLPILALIRASPQVLKEFLFGDWKPYGLEPNSCHCFAADGTGCMQYPLFRLLFTGIGDLAMGRNVEHDRLVSFVRFRPDHCSNPYQVPEGRSALMEIDLANQMTVSYDGSFDTDHTFYGEDLIVPDEETNFTFSSQVEIRCFWRGGSFFAPDDIPVLDGLFRSLRDGRTNAARGVFSRLSHPVQNMLRVYTDDGLEKESRFAGAVLQDLNRLLIRADLYSAVHFPGLVLTEAGKKFAEWEVEMGDLQYPGYIFGLMDFNRELLERAFPGMVPERERGEWETTRYFVQS